MAAADLARVLEAILALTPAEDRDAVCAAWEGLPEARQTYLACFPPDFVARWLLGQLVGWDDDAPMNVLPEGGYARQVRFATETHGDVHLWCLVPSREATTGELIHCHDGVAAKPGTMVKLELLPDGFARAVLG